MFVTTVMQKRQKFFQDPAVATEAIETLYRVQELHPFFLYAFVIMPNHCHFLLRVLAPETISKIMRVFKYGTSMNCGKGSLWQPRYHVRFPENPLEVLNYIHWNPVKAGLAEVPGDYPWSSASGKWDVSELGWWL